MFQHQVKPKTQTDIDAATLRAMINFAPLLQNDSPDPLCHQVLRVHTQEGAWCGVFGHAVSVAVNARLESTRLESNTPQARLISTCLRDVGRYAYVPENIEDIRLMLDEALSAPKVPGKIMTIATGGWNYNPARIKAGLNALGAPDSRVETGHFTLPGHDPISGVTNPLIWCFAGTVARHIWRMFVLPLEPGEKGESC